MLGPGEFDVDPLDETGCPREAEQVVDAVLLATCAISVSRAKPPSARSTIRTRGQRARMWATIRATSSTAPAEASMFERRSFAVSRWRPQNT